MSALPMCALPYCDRPAAAALYVRGGNILVRVDHVYGQPFAVGINVTDMFCTDCLLDRLEGAVADAQATYAKEIAP